MGRQTVRAYGSPTSSRHVDGVKLSGRIATLAVSLCLVCIVITILADGWVTIEDSLFFAKTLDDGRTIDWAKLGINGTAQSVELGFQRFCVGFRPGVVTSDRALQAGRICQEYTDGLDVIFGQAAEDHAMHETFGYDIIQSMNYALRCLWLVFGCAFVGALFSEKKQCTFCCSIFIVIGTILPLIIGSVAIKILTESMPGGEQTTENTGSFHACLAAMCMGWVTMIAAFIACNYTAASEIALHESNRENDVMQSRNFTEYGIVNDQIEFVGRMGALLGQLGWILYLSALMNGNMITTDRFGQGGGAVKAGLGTSSLGDFGFGNATHARLGLAQFCTKGVTLLWEGEEILPDAWSCYLNDEELGDNAVDICDVFTTADLCGNMNIVAMAVVIGICVALFGDWFSEKMMVQAVLQAIAAALGIFACSINSKTYDNDGFSALLGAEAGPDSGVYLIIGGICSLVCGSICCFLDYLDACRIEGNYAAAPWYKKCCVCFKLGHADLYDENGIESNTGGQCECLYGNQRARSNA